VAQVPPDQSIASRSVVKSEGNPGNPAKAGKPDGSRMQALYPKGIFSGHIELRKIYGCGLCDSFCSAKSKADGLGSPEGSRSECDMASVQVTTGV